MEQKNDLRAKDFCPPHQWARIARNGWHIQTHPQRCMPGKPLSRFSSRLRQLQHRFRRDVGLLPIETEPKGPYEYGV